MDVEVKTNLSSSLRRLTHEMATESLCDLTDQQLVERALTGCEEAVFQAIVRRHGAMIHAVCWRMLRHAHDTEDAFQATFLVLARNLRAVRKRTSLASWLHGVARRIALKARARAEVRRRHERRAAPLEDRAKQESLAALDDELAQLSERWRLPIVLCYLQGRTQDEAADQLGVSKSTLRIRLDEARRTLAERLTRRGVVWSAALLEVLLSECAGTAAPTRDLFASTAEAASGVHAGKPLTATVSTEVVALTEGAPNAMISSALKVAGLVFVTSIVALGAAVAASDFAAPPPALNDRKPVVAEGMRGVAVSSLGPARQHFTVAAPVPKDVALPKMFLVQNPSLTYLDAEGKEKPFDPWTTPDKLWPTSGRLSPDGRWVAAIEIDVAGDKWDLVIRPRTGTGEPVSIPLVFRRIGSSGSPIWSPDSERVLIWEQGIGQGGVRECAYRVYDRAAKTLTKVTLPDRCSVTDWSSDGKRFLADIRPTDPTVRVAWLNADGTGKPEYVSPEGENGYSARLSPDGKHVLYQASPIAEKPTERTKSRLYVMNLATGKRTAVDEPGETHGHCWSSDGTRVAYTWQRTLDKPAEVAERETLLITCDPDGRNRKTITSRKTEIPENSSGRSGIVYFFWVIDWR